MSQLSSNAVSSEKAGEIKRVHALEDETNVFSLDKSYQSEAVAHSAEILSYSQPGKISVSDFSDIGSKFVKVLNSQTIPVLALFTEFSIITATSFGAAALYHHYFISSPTYTNLYIISTILLSLMFCLPCGYHRDYSLTRITRWREQLGSVFLHWNTAYLVFAFTLFMTYATDFYSRGAIVAQYFSGLIVAVGLRFLLGSLVKSGLHRGVVRGKRALIVGDAASISLIDKRLANERNGITVLGKVTLPALSLAAPNYAAQTANDTREALNAIKKITRRTSLDEIVLSMPFSESHRIRQFADELAIVPTAVHLTPDATATWAHRLNSSRVGSLPTLKLSRAPLTLRDQILKRSFDLLGAISLLILALPIFTVIGLLIKLDSRGPVFFRQTRHGFNEGEFRIFKFRTMTTLEDGDQFRQATRHDTRITRIGKFLRRTNLDELPQLINVLLGEMSLVGPRPHAVAHNNAFEDKIRLYARRHNVKPGITGWSQINGYRGETDTLEKMEKRVDHDIYYIENWSILFDMAILFSTLFSKKAYSNAY